MIEIHGLRKSFGAVEAVRDVSFCAERWNCSRALGTERRGQNHHTADVIRTDAPGRGHDSRGRRRRGGGSDRRADPHGTSARLARLVSTPDARRTHSNTSAGCTASTDWFCATRSAALVARLGLNEFANRRVSGFSHGERTKVALARALVHRPRNVILDEPTNGLDVMSTRAVREVIRGLRQDGCCVLFSSHIMQEVSALCDRIVVIARGTVVAEGTAEELRSQTGRDNLEDAFVALSGLEAEELP